MDNRNYFIFDGISSLQFDVYINGGGAFNSPDPEYSLASIPGMNGNLHFNSDHFKNVNLSYEAFIIRDFKRNFTAFKNAMLQRDSYCRLEDTYFPGQFRLARVTSRLEASMVPNLEAGNFTIEFDCKPQRFLKEGEKPILLTESGSKIYNVGMPAKPLLKVFGSGSGTVSFGGRTMRLYSIDQYVMLDCEIQDAYRGQVNKNQNVSIPVYPSLVPGENEIVWSGGVTSIEIIPRWWVL